MTRSQKMPVLDDLIRLAVRQFGLKRVEDALNRARANGELRPIGPADAKAVGAGPRGTSNALTLAEELETIRAIDPEKHQLLTEFWDRLKSGSVLPDLQDIQQFSQLFGVKEKIGGKSRKEVAPKLMRLLLGQGTEALRLHIASAADISEQQRRRGFSVLADKLLREK